MKQISQLQVYTMFTQFLFSTAIGFVIAPLVQTAGFMAWTCLILGFAISLPFTYLACRLAQSRPGEFLGEYGKDIIGKWPHYILFSGAIFIHLYIAASILRQLTDFILQIYLPGTPMWAVASLFGICVARSVRTGPVNFFRSAQGLFLFSVISVFAFPLFAIGEVDEAKLIALMTDLRPHGIWEGAFLTAALYAEMAFVIYLYPHFEKKAMTFRTLVWSGITAILVTILNMTASLLLFGSELTAELTYPTLEMIRYIRAGSFLENLDPLLIVFWLFSMLLKIGLFLLIGTTMTAHLFGLKDHKPFSLSMAAAMTALSIVMFDTMADIEDAALHSESTMLLLKASMPALYLLVDWLRSRNQSRGENR